MPPVRPIPPAIAGMSDQDLADQLRDLGVKLGPILPSTRKVYERKLFELQTGLKAAPSGGYAPVDDDDEDEEDEDSPDEEVTIQQKQPRQRTTRTTRTEVETRTEPGRVSPRRPLHSDRQPSPSKSSSESSGTKSAGGGLPLWVKLIAILVIAAIVFLVIKNMESDPASNIPDQIEVNV